MKPIILTILSAALLSAQVQPEKPFIVFSTYFGGVLQDVATAVTTDSAGATYIAGETQSKNFPATALPGSAPTAVNRGFVTKFGPDGKLALWSFLLGGGSATRPNAIALDPAGNLWITGRTGSRDFPLLNPVQDKMTGLNISFLMKLSPEGKLLFSTLLGGERNDEANAMAIDRAGSVYIGGRTNSTTFPLKNPLNSTPAGGDAFLAKFSSEGKLEWSTLLGGALADEIFALAIGPDNDVYAAGEMRSSGQGTESTWQKQPTGIPGFAARISSSGDQLRWLTYIGGGRSGYTRALGMDVDAAGSAYIVGSTSATELPTTAGAIQPKYAGGLRDGFLLKLTPNGGAASYLTYLGGSFSGPSDPDEVAVAIRLDSHGYAYVAGGTNSTDFHLQRPVQGAMGGLQDGWLARIDVENGKLISSSYWGGSKGENAAALALGPEENVTIVGQSVSADYPVAGAAQPANGGLDDATLTRVCDPWLRAYPGELRFVWTAGRREPEAQEVEVSDGCSVAHELTEVQSEAAWIKVTPDRASMPGAKLKVAIDVTGLAPGEYRSNVVLTVPQAANGQVTIPVVGTALEDE